MERRIAKVLTTFGLAAGLAAAPFALQDGSVLWDGHQAFANDGASTVGRVTNVPLGFKLSEKRDMARINIVDINRRRSPLVKGDLLAKALCTLQTLL